MLHYFISLLCPPSKIAMPATLTYSPVLYAPATARTQLATRRRYAQYAETHTVQPLKGLRETHAASVSYRASVPAGHGGRRMSPSCRASSPDGATLPFRITATHSIVPQPTANCYLLTATCFAVPASRTESASPPSRCRRAGRCSCKGSRTGCSCSGRRRSRTWWRR